MYERLDLLLMSYAAHLIEPYEIHLTKLHTHESDTSYNCDCFYYDNIEMIRYVLTLCYGSLCLYHLYWQLHLDF